MSDGLTHLSKMPYSKNELIELLDRTRWLNELSWPEVQAFAKYVSAYQAGQGKVIFGEGSREAFLCVLAQGKVNIIKASAREEKKLLSVITPGRAFGEMSVIDGQPRSASAVAAETSLLLVLAKKDFSALMEKEPHLAVKFILKLANALSQRLRQTSGALVDFLH